MDKQAIERIRKALTGAEGKRLAKEEAAAAQGFDDGGAAARRDAGKLARKALASGKKADRFEALVKAQAKAAAERAREWQAAAVEQSKEGGKLLADQRAGLVRSLEVLAELDPTVPSPSYHLLNTPFLIWPTNSVDLEASEIVPSNSSAKFRARIGKHKSFFGDVKFYYIWDNATDKFAVINADGYSIFHGTAFVGVGGGIFPANRAASVRLTATLQILEWWNQPPTSPLQQTDQSAEILNLRVSAGGFGEVGAIELRNVFRGSDLRHTLMLVPPRGVVVFAVTTAVAMGTGDDDGLAEVDFASGEFMVGSPAVLVTVLT
ncbi:MAG: hypothetical protein KDJ83_04140 [Rhodobacteraceae bacterium]|nr:hypothetical protein [Paracoccaceae bacterium]